MLHKLKKRIYRAVVPLLTAFLGLLARRRNVASLSLFFGLDSFMTEFPIIQKPFHWFLFYRDLLHERGNLVNGLLVSCSYSHGKIIISDHFITILIFIDTNPRLMLKSVDI